MGKMTRGRPRKTDPDTALADSMKVFWEKGFQATSMSDLVAATGMAKPGLYATFGDKEALYSKALTHYFSELGAPLLDDLRRSSDPLPVVIRRFLETVAASVVDKSSPSGCFVVNSVVECAHHPSPLEDLARSFDAKRRAAFVERFRAAKKQGELPGDCDAKALAEFFASQALALAVMGRAGTNRRALNRIIDVAMQVIPAA
jgi:AcrR family transcriptional regulator